MCSGKKGVVGVLVTKVVLIFQEIKNKWITAHTDTIWLTNSRLQPRRENAKSLPQAGGHTLSCHQEPLQPSAPVRQLVGVLTAYSPCSAQEKSKTKHLLMQISYAWTMRLITPVPSSTQITSAPKCAHPERHFSPPESISYRTEHYADSIRSLLGFFPYPNQHYKRLKLVIKTPFKPNTASSHP